MKNLYLHIGSHKTGSTSIQQYCAQNDEELAGQGYCYFNKSPWGGNLGQGNGSEWIDESPIIESKKSRFSLSATVRNIEELCEALYKTEYDNIIFSAEAMASIHSQSEIERIRHYFSNSYNVKIVAYLRRQDLQVVSHNQEGSKGLKWPSFYYYGSLKALPSNRHETYGEYLDYHSKMEKWAKSFGHENILVRIFDRDVLKSGCVVNDFFNTIGLNPPLAPVDILNESLGFKAFKIGMLMNKANLTGKQAEEIRQRFQGKENQDEIKALPSIVEAKAFYEVYKKSNERLKESFNLVSVSQDLFSCDFSMYPKNGADEWSEDLANNAFVELFELLASSCLTGTLPERTTYTEMTLAEEYFLKLISKVAPSSRLRQKLRNEYGEG